MSELVENLRIIVGKCHSNWSNRATAAQAARFPGVGSLLNTIDLRRTWSISIRDGICRRTPLENVVHRVRQIVLTRAIQCIPKIFVRCTNKNLNRGRRAWTISRD